MGGKCDEPANRKGVKKVIGRLMIAAVLAGVAFMVVQSVPDIKRYLKIRRM